MFRPGHKVECIDDYWGPRADGYDYHPKVGDKLTVVGVTPPDIFSLKKEPHLDFEGLIYHYASSHFRRITDISDLQKIAAGVKEPA